MTISAQYKITLDNYLYMFPSVTQPRYSGTDFIARFGSLRTGGYNDLTFDGPAACVYPRKVWVPHDNLFPGGTAGGAGFPVVNWTAPSITGSLTSQNQIARPHPYAECQVGYTSSVSPPVTTFDTTAALSPCCQGFHFLYNIGAESTSPSAPCAMELHWQLGVPAQTPDPQVDGPIWYRLVIPIGGAIRVDRSSDNRATWTAVGRVETGGRGDQVLQPYTVQPHLHIEVTFLAGVMQVAVDSATVPWVYREFAAYSSTDSTFPWSINNVEVKASNLDQLRFSLHPTKFLRTIPAPGNPAFISGTMNLGFTPVTDPSWRIHYAPQPEWDPIRDKVNDTTGFAPLGCSAQVTGFNQQFEELTYVLGFTNPAPLGTGSFNGDAYSDFTAAVYAVSYHYNELGYVGQSNPIDVQATELSIDWHFDPGTRCISSSASFVVNDFNGSFGQYCDAHGNVGVKIEIGMNGGPMDTYFTGIANVDWTIQADAGGQQMVRVQCCDLWLPLQTESWNLPWSDGWNAYYFAAVLFQLSGISTERLAFKDFIPDDPYDETPGDTKDAQGNYLNTFFLPWGPGGQVTTEYTSGSVKANVLQQLASQIGFTAWQDQDGYFHFEQFILPTKPADRVLTSYGTDDARELLNNMTYAGTTRETRNDVSIIGVSPTGPRLEVVAHRQDDSRWDDTLPGFQGFIHPFVWTDSRFANDALAGKTADSLILDLKRPLRTFSGQAWIPLDIFLGPLDVVSVDYPKNPAHGKDFVLFDVGYRLAKGQAPLMLANGRWYGDSEI